MGVALKRWWNGWGSRMEHDGKASVRVDSMVKSLGSSQYGAYAGEGSIGGRGRPGSLDSKRAYAECLLEWSELNSKRDAMHSVGEQGVAQCRRDRRTRAGATSRSHKVDGCTSTDVGRSSEEQGAGGIGRGSRPTDAPVQACEEAPRTRAAAAGWPRTLSQEAQGHGYRSGRHSRASHAPTPRLGWGRRVRTQTLLPNQRPSRQYGLRLPQRGAHGVCCRRRKRPPTGW